MSRVFGWGSKLQDVNLGEPKEWALGKRVCSFWGEIHGVGKHMSGESFVSNLGESCETKREDSQWNQRLRVGSLLEVRF